MFQKRGAGVCGTHVSYQSVASIEWGKEDYLREVETMEDTTVVEYSQGILTMAWFIIELKKILIKCNEPGYEQSMSINIPEKS